MAEMSEVLWFANLRLAVGKWVCWAASCWHIRAFRHGSSDPASCLIHVVLLRRMQLHAPHIHKQKEKKTTLTQWLLRMDTMRNPLTYLYSHDPKRPYNEPIHCNDAIIPAATGICLSTVMISVNVQTLGALAIFAKFIWTMLSTVSKPALICISSSFVGWFNLVVNLSSCCCWFKTSRTVNSPGHEIRCLYNRYRFMTWFWHITMLQRNGLDRGEFMGSFAAICEAHPSDCSWLLTLFLAVICTNRIAHECTRDFSNKGLYPWPVLHLP